MKGIIEFTARLIMTVKRSYERKWSFCGVFSLVFFGSVGALGSLGLLPEAVPANTTPNVSLATRTVEAAPTALPELPAKIEVSAIGLVTSVANPTTTNIEELDQLLLAGAVRYPTSAKLGESGNVVLFGHSSYLPIVLNEAYKTFNNIQKLTKGDVVTVYSAGTAYTYQVRSIARENTNGAGVPLAVTGRVLTLVTCNSFGSKEDRFVVTADFVESHSIAS